MDTLLTVLLLALAAKAVATAWFQEGGLFSARRAYYEASTGLVAKLLTCRTCFAYHAAGWLLLLCYVPSWFLADPWRHLPLLPVYWLSATTLVHRLTEDDTHDR